MRYVLITLLFLLPASDCVAGSWLVMKDGSGDYTNFQNAVDGAAVGDTIWVGAGRYDAFHSFMPYNQYAEVVVGVMVDSLTIIGLDRDKVIIGPSAADKTDAAANGKIVISRIGLMSSYDLSWIHVENLSFENAHSGAYVYSPGIFRNCRFDNMNDDGLAVGGTRGTLIENCVSRDTHNGISIRGQDETHDKAIVRNCRIYDSQVGFRGGYAVISNIITFRCHTGISSQSGNTIIIDCTMNDSSGGGLSASNPDTTSVFDCSFVNSGYSDISIDRGHMIGSGNTLYGGCLYHTIWTSNASFDFKNNHIFTSDESSVFVQYHYYPEYQMAMPNNYWGTTDPDSISKWILDGQDDPAVLVDINYFPILNEPFSSVGASPETIRTQTLEAFPNPFNPQTTIRFSVCGMQRTKVAVYDLLGRQVRVLFDGHASGEKTVDWDGRNGMGQALSSGSYFVRVYGERYNEVRKVTLVR